MERYLMYILIRTNTVVCVTKLVFDYCWLACRPLSYGSSIVSRGAETIVSRDALSLSASEYFFACNTTRF